MRLDGKVAFIPGGTSGIGEQIAYAYAKEGATVIVASRSKDKVDRVAAKVKELGKGEGYVLDITDPDAVFAAVDKIVADYGKIDIMLNSAGIYPATPVQNISKEEFDQVVKIDMYGPFYCAQAAALKMIEQKSGSIIFITSGQGLRGVPLMAHYSAAKGGLVALARAMAAELGMFNIRVNTIAAGLTTTDMVTDNMPPEFLGMIKETVPLKRLGNPEDYNETAILLGSDGGSFITGVTIPVDGGCAQADAAH